jgi:hypothetical protein
VTTGRRWRLVAVLSLAGAAVPLLAVPPSEPDELSELSSATWGSRSSDGTVGVCDDMSRVQVREFFGSVCEALRVNTRALWERSERRARPPGVAWPRRKNQWSTASFTRFRGKPRWVVISLIIRPWSHKASTSASRFGEEGR